MTLFNIYVLILENIKSSFRSRSKKENFCAIEWNWKISNDYNPIWFLFDLSSEISMCANIELNFIMYYEIHLDSVFYFV